MSDAPVGLIVLDVDGTLVEGGRPVPRATVAALESARALGFRVTIITGRGLPRLRQGLGDDAARILGDFGLVAVEHGTRILRLDGSGQVSQQALEAEEIRGFVHRLEPGATDFVAYHPQTQPLWSSIWTPREGDVHSLQGRLSDATVGSGSALSFIEQAARDRPGMMVARLRDPASPGASGATWVSGHNATVVAGGRGSKAGALARLRQLAAVAPEDVIVAGNDEADAAMFREVPNRQRLIVGADAGLGAELRAGALTAAGPDDLSGVVDVAVFEFLRERAVRGSA